ncbi:MAG: hypothetical protein J4F44_03740 [Acidimicrobiia bacterium]|nr:hypothetical protein [Acidimicrobiia bacterium]
MRNSSAHNESFSTDDVLRRLDTAQRLLESVVPVPGPTRSGRSTASCRPGSSKIRVAAPGVRRCRGKIGGSRSATLARGGRAHGRIASGASR